MRHNVNLPPVEPPCMPEKLDLTAAVLDETVFIVPDPAKLTISPTNANYLTHIVAPGIETIFLYRPVQGDRLTDAGQVTMDRLINACKIPSDKFVVVNLMEAPGLHWKQIRKAPALKKLILLGCGPEQLGVHIEYFDYNIFNFNGIDILISDSMEVISDDRKKKLWSRLQTMFKLI